ncbi:hypothetical protein Plim_0959 [Planctopirus limnophila DSM 3776]|uniref:Uncharacterized protein n=1 Tax=Planctopirus limnophila (strain ATCC 43296 / DSM 3776 / IFAM 1008 / Mu 290) TaxID=521674 RepID=D5ST35_PLAL2|nr:hypothetical protein Plim_0959 [Planctopirus limnophila DSM 3776]
MLVRLVVLGEAMLRASFFENHGILNGILLAGGLVNGEINTSGVRPVANLSSGILPLCQRHVCVRE